MATHTGDDPTTDEVSSESGVEGEPEARVGLRYTLRQLKRDPTAMAGLVVVGLAAYLLLALAALPLAGLLFARLADRGAAFAFPLARAVLGVVDGSGDRTDTATAGRRDEPVVPGDARHVGTPAGDGPPRS